MPPTEKRAPRKPRLKPTTKHHLVDNGDGWMLSLHQTWIEGKRADRRRPVLILPGYGMNSHIFSFHPRGVSLEGYLAEAGFEVWRADLRAQGKSVATGGDRDYRIEDLAVTDLGAAIQGVLKRTRTGSDRVDVIGCSLGGTFMFVHAVLNPGHRMGSLVAMGSPVRWVSVHPVIRMAFAWPMIVGLIRIRGTRKFAELALPYLVRFVPWLLSVYLNPSITDTSAAREMVKTVEDPNHHVNREIACWIRDRDLVVQGVNISDGLRKVDRPLLCVLANADGIVPRATAEYPFKKVKSRSKKILHVGTREISVAHADLFISNESHARVFEPIARWLKGQ